MDYISTIHQDGQTFVSHGIGVKSPLHIHRNMEAVVVTEGRLHMMIGQTPCAIETGCAALIEPFVPHSFSNAEAHICYVIEHPPELSPTFQQWLREHVLSDCMLRLDPPLHEYLCARLQEYPRRHRLDILSAQALLAPLYGEFAARAHALRRIDRFGDVCLDVLEYITQHVDGDLSLSAVAAHLHIRPETLCRKFSERVGMSMHKYIQHLRINQACALLRLGHSVSDTAYQVGFGSIRTFNRLFREVIGRTPMEYRCAPADDDFYARQWEVTVLESE